MTATQPAMLVRALALRVALPALLWALPLDRVLRLLTRRPPMHPRQERPALETIERVTDLLTREVPLARTACLPRALLRYALLCDHGYPAVFVIGVRGGGQDGFQAHAWVEVDGVAVMERQLQACKRTFAFPASAALG